MKRLQLFFTLLIFSLAGYSANITWTNGNGTGIWNDAGNWSAGIPGPSDLAIFNATSTADCLIDISVDIRGITLQSGYTGTVTQGAGNTMLIRFQDLSLFDGKFVGSDASIDMIDGNFTIRGGIFVSTSDTLFLDVNFVVSDSGLFYHNNGTVVFNDGGNRGINILSRDTLFNMVVEPTANNLRVDLNGADTLIILNRLSLNEGRLRGGVVELSDSLTMNPAYDLGTSQIWFKGTGNSNLAVNGGVGSHPFTMDKDNATDTIFVKNDSSAVIAWGNTSDRLTVISGTVLITQEADLDFNELEIRAGGTFIASSDETRTTGAWDNQGGSFKANQGRWVWEISTNRNYRSTVVDTFFNVTYNSVGDRELRLLADDSMYVLNRIDLLNGRIQTGNVLIEDSAFVNSTYDDGSADLWFVGTGTSQFFIESAVGNYDFYVRKNSSTDTVFARPFSGGSLNVGETDRDLVIEEGILSFALVDTADIDYSDIFIETGAELIASPILVTYQGNWRNQGGLFSANGGKWVFDIAADNRVYTTNAVDSFFSLEMASTGNNLRLILAVDDSIYIENKLELTNGRFQAGNLLVEDTAILYSTYDDATADLWFVGSTSSNFFIESAEGNFDIFIRKANSTDTVFYQPLTGNSLNIGETDRDLTIQEGVLSFDLVDTVDLDYSDIFIQSGAQLQASSGILNYQGNWSNTGGLFNANGGTWIWDNTGNRTYASTVVDTFFTLLYQPTAGNLALSAAADDSIYIQNRIDLTEGRIQNGQLLINDTAYLLSNYDDGTADLWFIGSTTSNFFIQSAVGDIEFYIRKINSTDTVFFQPFSGNSLNIGETDRDLTIQEGILSFGLVDTADLDFSDIFIQPGAQLQGSPGIVTYQGNWNNQGGLFNANNGSWEWNNGGNRSYATTVVDTFFNFNYNAANNQQLTLAANDSIYIQNKLELTNGRVQAGNLLVLDTAYLYATYDDATADLFFVGSITSNFIIEAALGNFDKFIRKENATDTVFYEPLSGNSLNIGETDRDLTIEEGVLSFALVSDTVDLDYGDINIETGAQIQATSGVTLYQGSWNNQGGLFNANGGDWVWNNNGGNRTYVSASVDTFFNFNYSPVDNRILTIASGDSIYVQNKLELSNGRLNTGNVLIEDTAILYTTYDDGNADLYFIGSTPSNFLIGSAVGDFDLFIRKTNSTDTVYFQPLTGNSLNIGETDRDLTIDEGVLSLDLVDTANLDYSDIIIQSGAQLQASRRLTQFQGNWNNVAGAFNANGGTWLYDLGGDRNYTSHQSDTFFRMVFQPPNGNNDLTITGGDEFTVEQALFLDESAILNGTVRVLDSLEINANYDNNSSADIYFEGAGDGSFIYNATAARHDFFINKANTTARVEAFDENGGALNFGTANINLTIQQGRLEFPSNDPVISRFANTFLSLGGTYQAPSGSMIFDGNWSNNQGKLEANGGTFTFRPNANRTYSTTEVDTFFNFVYNANGNRITTMAADDTIRVMNSMQLVNGRVRTGVLSAAGDVTVSSTYDGDALQADLQFVGPNPQNFDLTGGTDRMDGDIYFDKSVAADVTLNSRLDIDRSLQSINFNKGYLVTTQTNDLFIDGVKPVNGANDSSFVKGPVVKRGNQVFTFPIGDTVYAPLTISGITNGVAQFRGEYIRTDPTNDAYDVSLLEAGINNVSIIEYWQLDRVATTASCQVTLSWRNTSAVVVPAELTVARWNSGTLQWEDEGNTGTTGTAANGTVTSNLINTFSPFTLGSTTINNPLPVTYKYFEAIELPSSNLLEWATLSEINADYFDVQRSVDGKTWNSIGTVAANGNSNQEIKYEFTDLNIDEPIVYYRLIQYDFDGTANPSDVVAINRKQRVESELSIYPNPVSDGTVTLSIKNQDMNSPRLSIISMQGQVVMQRDLRTSFSQRIDIDISSFSKGTYFVRIEGIGEVVTKKLIVL